MANLANLFDSAVTEIKVSYTTNIKPSERYQVKSSQDIYQLLLSRYENFMEHHEEIWAVYLNRSNKVLGVSKISQGGVSETTCDPKLVIQIALKANASSIIVTHNHPAGSVEPSEADKRVTRKIKSACEFLDMQLLDHVIISHSNYYSFADSGLL